MYTFSDGHYYMGNFSKGKMNGAGKMYYESASGQDSIITGFWKKNNYIGEYENPFIVLDQTSNVGRVEVYKSGKGKDIIVEMKSMSGGMGAQFTASLSETRIKSGNYNTKSTNRLTNSEITTFKDVTFPFRAVFVFGVATLEIEFYEESNYKVMVPLQ